MKTIARFLLLLAVPVAFSGSLDELRARRDLSPYHMRKWLEFRALLPLPAYFHGDVAQGPCKPGAAPTAKDGESCDFTNGV